MSPSTAPAALVGSDAPALHHAQRQAAHALARQAWPNINVSLRDFCLHLDRLGHTHQLPLHVSSVYLCLAGGLGLPAACVSLEARYFSSARSLFARFDARQHALDEMMQDLRARLLVGPDAKILTYRGHGTLEGWLRRIARTMALDRKRGHSGEDRCVQRLRLDTASLERLCGHHAPISPEELAAHRAQQSIVQRALLTAISGLTAPERQSLHHYFVSSLNIDQLGTLYGVNRSTAARRILRNVSRLRRAVRRELLLELDPREVESPEVWACMSQDRLELDLEALLST